jgi:hypothetical protein
VLYPINRRLTLTSFITLYWTSRCKFMLTRRICINLDITRRLMSTTFYKGRGWFGRKQSSFAPDWCHIIIHECLTSLNSRLNNRSTLHAALMSGLISGLLRAWFAARTSVVINDKRCNAARIHRLKSHWAWLKSRGYTRLSTNLGRQLHVCPGGLPQS